MRAGPYAFTAVLLAAALAGAAQQSGTYQRSSTRAVASKQTAVTTAKRAATSKPNLSGLSLESPEAVASSIRVDSPKGAKTAGSDDVPGVTEMQAASPAPGKRADGSSMDSAAKGNSALKRVHSEVYGALAPGASGTQAANAAVGATSKSGKAYIYIETDHSKASSPR